MARRARPWFRSADNWWYVWHKGRQVKLAQGENNRAKAEKAFHELKAGDLDAIDWVRMKVVQVFDVFLDYLQREASTETYRVCRPVLQDAADYFGNVRVAALKVHHVDRWLRRRRLADSTRARYIGLVKAALNHCVKQGYLPDNPIRHMPKPTTGTRDRLVSRAELETILASVRDEAFRDLVSAWYQTGARPSELARLRAEHIDWAKGVIVLSRHKTIRKQGKPRIIYLTPAMEEILRRRLAGATSGYVFTGRRGNPWNRNSIYQRFQWLREKHPELQGITAYSFRHSFATDALERGVPEAVVAELLGHSSTQMLYRHYAKLSQRVERLRAGALQARRVDASTSEPGSVTPHPVETRPAAPR